MRHKDLLGFKFIFDIFCKIRSVNIHTITISINDKFKKGEKYFFPEIKNSYQRPPKYAAKEMKI